ncbi:MAG TPA: pyridoxal phosphate-dependent aminotransferase family protein [Clostridia bacterium]|nr:pyridoxal phosphate-dependent aminotransferase family protein [Clostridia bacterium]
MHTNLMEIDSNSGAHMSVSGRDILNFTGCCYLGICAEPSIVRAGTQALERYGSLGQIPRHYGSLPKPYMDVEEAAADYFKSESSMFFAAGYLFASMALQGLLDQYDVLFLDEKAHYSIRDGAAATHKPTVWFSHANAEDLEEQMKLNLKPGQRPMIATDGMFPTYGDVPPLDKYMRLVEKYDGWMVIDESHSLGVFGQHGRGVVEKFGLTRERVISGGSMAKAFCAYGAVAMGSSACIKAIWQSPPARGAAGGMTAAAAMSAASLRYVAQHPELLQNLRHSIAFIKSRMNAMGIPVGDTESPNVTFSIGTAKDMLNIQQSMFQNNIYMMYSNYVGAAAEGVLRCSLFADHTEDDIERFLDTLKRYLP